MAGQSIKFTKVTVKGAICPPGHAEFFYWSADLKGFGIRAYASGRRVWFVQYRTKEGVTRKSKIGDLNKVALDDERMVAGAKGIPAKGALSQAKAILADAELGGDPQADAVQKRQAATVIDLIDAYLPTVEARRRPKTFKEIERALRRYAKPLHRLKAQSVTRLDIAELLDAVKAEAGGTKLGAGGTTANRVHAYLSTFYTWAITSGRVDCDNPVAKVQKPAGERRGERVLGDDELALIWRCTSREHDHDRIVRLLLLTGARAAEVGSLPWAEVQLENDDGSGVWTLASERSKNGLQHEIPLGRLAIAQLPTRRGDNPGVFGRGTTGFSGWSKCKERLDARIVAMARADFIKHHDREPDAKDIVALPRWTHHDLRRTFSTWANESGIEPHIVEAVLNHVSGASRAGVAGVYNKARYRAPKRAALAAWERHVRGVCGLPVGDASGAT